MTVEHLEVLVEEASMEATLRVILPRILNSMSFEVYPHQCKTELVKRLPVRLQAYANWLPDTWRILVIVDRDDDDCKKLKKMLDKVARDAGLSIRSGSKTKPYNLVNRLAIEELEAWYFGDWTAVRTAYAGLAPTIPNQRKYRDPDAITGGTWEALERLLQGAGYFKTGLRKIEAARTISEHMVPERNSSASFQALYSVLLEML